MRKPTTIGFIPKVVIKPIVKENKTEKENPKE